jgi:hypothetical protein
VEEARRPGSRVAPRGWVLLKRRKGVREVLPEVVNRTQARLTSGNFGGEAATRADEKEQNRGALRFGVECEGDGNGRMRAGSKGAWVGEGLKS